jgi:hypothetical protein
MRYLLLLLLLLALPALAYTPARECFWAPYRFTGDGERLYHLDREAVVDEELVKDDGEGEGAGEHWLENADPGGRPVEVLGPVTFMDGGRLGGAARLDGRSALRLAGVPMSKQKTLEFSLYLEHYPTGTATLVHHPGGPRESYRLLLGAEGTLTLEWDKKAFPPAGRIPLKTWTHVALNWNWRFTDGAESASLYLNGTRVGWYPHLDVDKLCYGQTLIVGNAASLDGGIVGLIDELRLFPRALQFYAYDLAWPRAALPDRPAAPPYFRDATDLLVHLPLDTTWQPATARVPVTVEEKELSPRVGANADPELLGFAPGALGKALRLGAKSAKPVIKGEGLLSSTAGTLAFWVRPQGWDTYQSVDHRREKGFPVHIPLFKIYGELSPEAKPRRPMRGNDPSLLAVDLFFHPDSNRACRVQLHPGAWTHLALCWRQGQWRYFINGQETGPDAAFSVSTHAWYDRTQTMDVFTGSTPDRLVFDGQFGQSAAAGTLLDDFRIYRRPLSALEIANLVALADHRRAFTPLPPLVVTAHGNGILGRVRVQATPLLKEYARVARVEARFLTEAGAELGRAEAPVPPEGDTPLTLTVPPYDFGRYRLVSRALAATGEELARQETSIERIRPRWWGSKLGLSAKVMPGWTPMTVREGSVGTVGRDLHFGPGGLPARVTSVGGDVLRGPIRLDAWRGEQALALAPMSKVVEITKASETQVETRGTLTGDGLKLTTAGVTEYDGLSYFTLTLAPQGSTPATLDRLTLTIPYAAESAELLHWWSGKQGFRDPKVVGIERVPPTPGVILRSTDARVERDPRQRGSMIPYVLLTGMARGMAWFAENDQGWTLQTAIPAVQVVRRPDGVDLILTLLAEPLALREPRVLRFGLHPVPVKPLTPVRRTVALAGYAGPLVIDSFSGNNLKGDESTTFNLLPDGERWDAVRALLKPGDSPFLGRAAADNAGFERRLGRAPTPEERTVGALYWDMHWGGGDPPDSQECREAYGGDWWRRPEFVDYASWAFDQWLTETKGAIEGVYLDDLWGVPESGTASYRLPDGHVQLGYHFLLYRERIKRMRQLLVDHGITPHLTGHSTHTLFIPYHSFFDVITDGEDHYASPDRQTDFIDHWPLERLLFAHPAKWGLVTSWLGPWGNSCPADKYPAWAFRQTRAYQALLSLADVGAPPVAAKVWPTVKLLEPGTVYHAPWLGTPVAEKLPAGVQAVAWTRPGQAVVLVVNLGQERVAVDATLHLTALGFPDPGRVTLQQLDPELLTYFAADATTLVTPDDPEKGEPGDDLPDLAPADDPAKLSLAVRRERDPDGKFTWAAGRLQCPVRRHDYRLFLLEAQ